MSTNLMTLLEKFKAAASAAEQAAIAEEIKRLTTPPPVVVGLKETRVAWKDGRLSFSGGRVNSEYAFQHLAELTCAAESLKCVSWHLGGERKITSTLVGKSYVARKDNKDGSVKAGDTVPDKYEDHTYLGKMDCKDNADTMQARFDAACDAILAAANWVEDYRAAEVAQENTPAKTGVSLMDISKVASQIGVAAA